MNVGEIWYLNRNLDRRCEKWRMLPVNTDSEQLPDKWFCEMNTLDSVNNTCDAPEKDTRWYYRHLSAQLDNVLKDSPVKCIARETIDSALSQEEKAKLVESDKILTHLLKVTAGEQKSSVISKYYFHDALLAETEEQALGDDAASIADADAPTEGLAQKQPIRESLVESIDKAYAIADENTATIGGIVRSLEEEFGVGFEKETKAFVRNRLKELMRESVESTKPAAKSKEENALSTTRANPLPACKAAPTETKCSSSPVVDEGLNAESNCAKSKFSSQHIGTAVVETNTMRSPRQGCFSTPEKCPQLDGNSSEGPGVAQSTPSSPLRSSSRSIACAMASPNGAGSPSTRRKTSPARRTSPLARAPRASPNSKVAKSRGRVGRKRSGARVTATEESARMSPRKERSSSGVTTSSKKPSARPPRESTTDVDLLSDSSDEGVIEILSDSDTR
jgi:hypothetical protein